MKKEKNESQQEGKKAKKKSKRITEDKGKVKNK